MNKTANEKNNVKKIKIILKTKQIHTYIYMYIYLDVEIPNAKAKKYMNKQIYIKNNE